MLPNDKSNKKQICVRIPQELDCKLTELVNKIGISKPAFILSLIYRELEDNRKRGNK